MNMLYALLYVVEDGKFYLQARREEINFDPGYFLLLQYFRESQEANFAQKHISTAIIISVHGRELST